MVMDSLGMAMYENLLVSKFLPFTIRKIKVAKGVEFLVEHRVETVAHKEGRFWPFRGKTWTEKVYSFHIGFAFMGDYPSLARVTQVSEVTLGSQLYFEICKYKEEIVEAIRKSFEEERLIKEDRDTRIHACEDSFVEFVENERKT
jgi:hypothetical protein